MPPSWPPGLRERSRCTPSNTTNLVLDIDGYFVPTGSGSTLAFYALTPCRVLDTRNLNGNLGGPYLQSGQDRAFPVLSSDCQIPSSAQAYSMNFTVVPYNGEPLGYLTVWAQGSPKPGGLDLEQSDRHDCSQCRHRARGNGRRNCCLSVRKHPTGRRH